MQNQTIEGYVFEKRLGRGSFGEVWRVRREKDSKPFAVKIVNGDDCSVEMEMALANNIRFICPFLVRYFRTFRQNESLFIVMELCEQGDLRALLKTLNKKKGVVLSSDRIMKIFIQLILGLHELHETNIIHRDIKPENSFINGGDDIKIGDFGCVRMLESTTKKASTYIGTPSYMAPEIFETKPYDAKSDMWSLGVLMYEICTLELPFTHPNPFMLPMAIMQGKYKPIPKYTLAEEIIAAVHSLLTLDPVSRPSTLDLLRLAIVQDFANNLSLLKYFPTKALVDTPNARFIGESGGGDIGSGTAGGGVISKAANVVTNVASTTMNVVGKPVPNTKYLPNPDEGYTLSGVSGLDVTVTTSLYRSLLLDTPLNSNTTGIYRLTVSVAKFGGYAFCLGVILHGDIKNLFGGGDRGLGDANESRGAAYRVGTNFADLGNNGAPLVQLESSLGGVPDGQLSVEVNMNERMLHFYNGTRLIPAYVSEIPSNLRVGFTSYSTNEVIHFVSFQQLSSTTISNASSLKAYQWHNSETASPISLPSLSRPSSSSSSSAVSASASASSVPTAGAVVVAGSGGGIIPNAKYMPNPGEEYTLSGANNLDVTVTTIMYRSLVLDTPVTTGIVKLSLTVSKFSTYPFCLGAILASDVQNLFGSGDRSFGDVGEARGVGYRVGTGGAAVGSNGGPLVDLDAVAFGNCSPNTTLSVEVNLDKRTVHFFNTLNGTKQIPVFITKVPSNLRLGFTAYRGHELIRFGSLQRLTSPSASLSLNGAKSTEWYTKSLSTTSSLPSLSAASPACSSGGGGDNKIKYIPNPDEGYTLSGGNSLDVKITSIMYRTLLLDGAISTGIVKLTISVGKFSSYAFCLGAVLSSDLQSLFGGGDRSLGDTAGIAYRVSTTAASVGVSGAAPITLDADNGGTPETTLSMEIDLKNKRTIHFFNNSRQVPLHITKVPPSSNLRVGFTAYSGNDLIRFISFQQMATPTAAANVTGGKTVEWNSSNNKTPLPALSSPSGNAAGAGSGIRTSVLKYIPNPDGDYTLCGGAGNLDVKVTSIMYRSFVLDTPVASGVLKLTVSVVKFAAYPFCLGAIPASDVPNLFGGSDRSFGDANEKRGVGYKVNTASASLGNNGAALIPLDAAFFAVPGGALSVEVNTDRRTIHFFNGAKQVPQYITKIPTNLRVGFTAYSSNELVRFVSLQQLTHPSANAQSGKGYEWH